MDSAKLRRRANGLVTSSLAIVVVGFGMSVLPHTVANATSTKTPIVVGGQGTIPFEVGVATGFKARIDAFNKAGGLDGRKIKFLGVLTTASSATTSQSNSAKLVETDHVMVDAPYISLVSTASATGVLKTNQVPFVGWLASGGAVNNKYGISITGAQVNPAVQSEGALIEAIKAMERTSSYGVKNASQVKMALVGLDSAGGTFVTKTYTDAAKDLGIDVVYSEAPIPFTATNFAPYAQNVLSSGANAVFEVTDAPASIGLAGALKAAGFKGFIVNGITYYPGNVTTTEEPPLTGVYVFDEFPTNQTKSPSVSLAEKRLKAIGAAPDLTNGVSVGYWSGDVLIALLQATAKRVGVGRLSGAAIQSTAAAGWTYKGGVGALKYPRDFTTPNGCTALVKEVGKSYKLIVPFTCYPTKLAHTGL